MAGIEPISAMLNEGAAMRIGHTVSGTAEGETHVYFDNCEETKTVTLPDMETQGTGRILDVTMTLKDVCPAKRLAVGITVSEVDQGGSEHARGFRAVTVPAHNKSGCCDITMPMVRFILPEDLRVDGGGCICQGARHFVIRTTCHYVDTDIVI